jgi:hypothetical protein
MDGGAAGNGRAILPMLRAARTAYAEFDSVERAGEVRL